MASTVVFTLHGDMAMLMDILIMVDGMTHTGQATGAVLGLMPTMADLDGIWDSVLVLVLDMRLETEASITHTSLIIITTIIITIIIVMIVLPIMQGEEIQLTVKEKAEEILTLKE